MDLNDREGLIDGQYGIADLVDLDEFRKICEHFTECTGFTVGFLDHPGLNVLIATGWRDICVKFHRSCPESAAICLKSNRLLLDNLNEAGTLSISQCENGLVDCAFPIIVKGKHIASLATGQLLIEKPDRERFRQQAGIFGFDEEEYLKALDEVPVVSEEQLRSATAFLGKMTHFLSDLGYARITVREETEQLKNEISVRKKTEQALRESEEALQQNAHRTEVLLQLNQMTTASLTEITDYALEEAIRLTGSAIGYVAFLNEDESILTMHSWSRTAMAQCNISQKPIHYPLKETGLWGEAVRQRKPVITNDYSAPSPLKKGCPAGHVRILRHMNIPVFVESHIVMVAGVGNKEDEYNEEDVQQLTLLMEGMWRLVERKRAEEERKSLQERLQRAEKMEALGTLAGGVAHDLNNVLGVVIGYAELLLHRLEEASPLGRDVKCIMQGGERAAAIVNDLLTLARRGVQTSKIINLNTLIMDSQKAPEFEKMVSLHPRVQVEMDLEADLLNIAGSPVHLGKSIMNLVSNAVESMPDGGLLKITTSNRYLDRPVQGYDDVRQGDYVVLCVSDTGEGIASNDIKRIFEPFYTKKIMGKSGTGLGLSVVWGTVKDHNGYIDVKSEEGKGSAFTLYFPVTREDISKEQQRIISMSEYAGNNESILVVDDADDQRDMALRMLTGLNYRVISVSSGEAAVEYLLTNTVDLALLDMIMDPGMDGLDTYRKILEIHPRQKAIIVSGFSESARVKEAQTLGAGAYVRKPYIMERLGLAVRTELDRKN